MIIKGIACATTVLVFLLASACNAAPVDTAKEAAAVRATEVQWNADSAARDPARFASYYTADAVDIGPGSDPLRGPAAIQAGMTQAFKDPNFSLTFAADKVEIAAGGDMAYTQGHFTETETSAGAQAKLVQSGSYVTVYKKQADGSWKAVADIASPGPPSGAPKTAN
ncbi:MAG TPA: SgcJ/EcaC family oxidoreductase [Caulobacteraceae bacterium]|jgi:uncharacterized protein (TIGR02246 family)